MGIMCMHMEGVYVYTEVVCMHMDSVCMCMHME